MSPQVAVAIRGEKNKTDGARIGSLARVHAVQACGETMKKIGSWASLLSGLGAFLVACQGLQLNIPLEVQTVRREEAALLVLVENKSTFLLRVVYPIQTAILRRSQHAVFSLPQPGNYRVVVAAYQEGRHHPYEYRQVASLELPVFLNGYDLFQVRGRFVGHLIEVTDGMLVPYR